LRTYNLFRRKDETDLCCAAHQDVAVPVILVEGTWKYAQSLDVETLSGFDAASAEASALLNGFYLFHSAACSEDPA
jgi:hypothetical protein